MEPYGAFFPNFSGSVTIRAGEYITGIDMMIGDYSVQKVINLLTIHTNVKSYGPFGKAKESKTNILIKKGSLVGFYGRAGEFLNTIGIFEVVQPDHEDKDMSIGPLGGPDDEGNSWTYKPPGGQITQIVIRHGIVINYIVFQGKTRDGGALDFSQRFGTTNKISFGPGEYITGIEVMLGEFFEATVVYSLSIRTNLTKYGPFGIVSGTRISCPITDGRVVGFFGRSATYLNAIGAHTVTKTKSTGPFQENKVLISSQEYITGVDVMVGEYAGESVTTRLSFHTTITSYGPYGSVSGSNISIPIKNGGVVGFFGRSGSFLNSIGIFAIVK